MNPKIGIKRVCRFTVGVSNWPYAFPSAPRLKERAALRIIQVGNECAAKSPGAGKLTRLP